MRPAAARRCAVSAWQPSSDRQTQSETPPWASVPRCGQKRSRIRNLAGGPYVFGGVSVPLGVRRRGQSLRGGGCPVPAQPRCRRPVPAAGAAPTRLSRCVLTCCCEQDLAERQSRSVGIGLQKRSQRLCVLVKCCTHKRSCGVTSAGLPGLSCFRIWLCELLQKHTQVFVLPPACFCSSLSCPSAWDILLIQQVKDRYCTLTQCLLALKC